MSDIRWKASSRGTSPVTLLSTSELSSLANNSGSLSASIQNSGDLDLYTDLELAVTFGTNPTADSVVEAWVARQVDGSTFEDATGGATPITPRNGFVGNFVLRAVTSAQRMVIPGVVLPPGDFKLLVVNKSGQSFPTAGGTVKGFFYREQVSP